MNQDFCSTWKLFDAMPCYILLFDCKGSIKMANKTFLNAIEVSSNEIAGMNLEYLEPYYYIQGAEDQFAEVRRRGSRTYRTQLVDTKGNAVPVEQTLLHVEDEGRHCILSIGRDISELIREKQQQEVKLRKAEEAVAAANHLKSEFIANVNHEIRTPMNAIIGYSEMLSASDLGEREQRFVKTITKNGATLISILNDVVELSKLESGAVKITRKTTDLPALVDEVVDRLTDRLSTGPLDFSSTIQPDLPLFFVLDDNHCRQIVTNLLRNAFKFTSRGKVTLAVTGKNKNADCFELSFAVTDTGIGISEEEQKSIAALLEQHEDTSEQQSGGRLGLTLCARLARMMGGRIALASEPGHGSTFIFTLPAQPVGVVQGRSVAAKQHLNPPELDGNPPLLLVVDDMPMIVCHEGTHGCISIQCSYAA